MPFLLTPPEFARRACHVIERKARYVVIPWQMGIAGWVMRLLPAWIWDKMAQGKMRKPRYLKQD